MDTRTFKPGRVIDAGEDDEGALAELLAEYAQPIRPYVSLASDYADRHGILPSVFRHELARLRARAGLIRTFDGHYALALWEPHTGAHTPAPDPYPEQATGSWTSRFDVFNRERHAARAELVGDRPHLHLRDLAVRAGFHGTGLEERLLDDQLARSDAEDLAIYADPAEEATVAYLRDFGFEPVAGRETVNAGFATLHPLVREPVPAGR